MSCPRAWYFLFGLLLAAGAAPLSSGATDEVVAPFAPTSVADGRFSEAQREYIHSWIRQVVPEVSRNDATPAVDQFLEALRRGHPAEFDRLQSPNFPVHRFRSLLLQSISTNLKGVSHADLRARVARERVRALLESEGAAETSVAVPQVMLRIEGMAASHLRRLEEGRTDDHELSLLIKRALEGDRARSTPTVTPEARELSASDIVAEYARRNQDGAALPKLQAISYRGELTSADGRTVEVYLSKLRPNRFRMTMRVDQQMRSVVAFDGRRYWRQESGRPPQILPAEGLGPLRHLAEFSDPLFGETGASFEKLENRTDPDGTFYRIAVRRRDGSRYVAWIDPVSFEQVGREVEDGAIVRFSDFEKIGGVTLAFQEQSVDASGQETSFTIKHAAANPALIQPYFEPAAAGEMTVFDLQPLAARSTEQSTP